MRILAIDTSLAEGSVAAPATQPVSAATPMAESRMEAIHRIGCDGERCVGLEGKSIGVRLNRSLFIVVTLLFRLAAGPLLDVS